MRAMDETTQGIPLETTINDLVQSKPDSLPLLTEFGIDTCCGGGSSLREAALEAGVDPEQVVAALTRRGSE